MKTNPSIAFRGARRARVNTYATVMEPGHPGAASFGVVDLSEGGLFIADEQAFVQEDQLRVGLPIADGTRSVWASGTVVWRGKKDGQDGAGIRLNFEHLQAAECWKETVEEWIGLQSVATVASLRQSSVRKLGASE